MSWCARLLAACACVAATLPAAAGDLYADYDALLADAVEGESVDYELIRDRHRQSLERMLDRWAAVDPDRLERDDRLAFLINLYNASMMAAVIEQDLESWTPAADGFAVFKAARVRLGGNPISLDHLEHQLIRPVFEEPRIHVALVCAARSCPPILDRAWRGDDLEATLEARMRRFVNDPARNRIDPEGRTLELSQIFEWFADDFGGRARLPFYVDGYTHHRTRFFRVTFIPYDWSLNIVQR